MLPEDLIRTATEQGYNDLMVIIGIVVAFFFIVVIAKILPNRVQLITTGISLKISKKYKCGDIIRIGDTDWYLDHLNAYRMIFRKVIKWDKTARTIQLDQDEELSIDYIGFLSRPIHKIGNCRA